MNIIKRVIAYTALAAMSFTLVGCMAKDSTLESTLSKEQGQVIATVNGKAIEQGSYEALFREYLSYFGESEEAADYLNEQKKLLLDELINTEVLIQKAEALGLTCTDETAKETLNEIKVQYGEDTLSQMLEQSQITEAQYLNQIKQKVTLKALREEMVSGDLTVTEDEVAAYYDENKSNYMTDAGAEITHILVRKADDKDEEALARCKAEVQDIQKKLAEGTSFDELVKYYSSESVDSELYTAEKLGFVAYDDSYYDEAFLQGAKSLAEGEVSSPIKSSFGYHFIQVHNKTEASVTPLEEAKAEITSILEEEKQHVMYQETLENWVSEADIVRHEDRIQTVA